VLSQIKGKPVSVDEVALKENQTILEKHRWEDNQMVATFSEDSKIPDVHWWVPTPSITGTYEGLATLQGAGDMPLRLKLDGSPQSLRGTLETAQGSVNVRGTAFDDHNIKLEFDAAGNTWIMNGIWENNKISGTVVFTGFGSAKVELKKVP